ncbi:hypothetical protein JTE90_011906 [Oedothorax gibbosus]|uniref:Uncharacterized protein n=1 Tax=Oedothorax gibbosus TaxID=931172 RepID=A0AAV6V2U0_9ARAC|nr:hypothetical protein JTE90_011906 [Oedothorax gibbosus]
MQDDHCNYVCQTCAKKLSREYNKSHSVDSTTGAAANKNVHCSKCKVGEEYKKELFRDCGKGPSDCRYRSRHTSLGPRDGPAVDFDTPVHCWNCLGHTHCRHGQTGVVEERAITFLRDSSAAYKIRPEICCGAVWCVKPTESASFNKRQFEPMMPYF